MERVFLTERSPPKDQERVGDAGSRRTVPSKVHAMLMTPGFTLGGGVANV